MRGVWLSNIGLRRSKLNLVPFIILIPTNQGIVTLFKIDLTSLQGGSKGLVWSKGSSGLRRTSRWYRQ